ncbi:MAG TPA: nickel-responsive transcriptional regulator NikR [Candidatus Bathyarchaeia archaeon]|nr:nickel-responsive transcriptional regulator NikR [Candidatus Bathyarchaeia archaeon]
MRSKEKVTRISLSLSPELLQRFDEVATKMGFVDRSKAIQSTLRNFISEEKHSFKANEPVTAVITVVYNHEIRGIDAALTDVEHENVDQIASSLHVHLGASHCLKIVVLKGRASEVAVFEKALRNLNGVMQLKATFLRTEMDTTITNRNLSSSHRT